MNANTLLALLVVLELVDRDKAKTLAERLTNATQPAKFDDAEHMVKLMFEELDPK
jgi:hypothetical protein